VPRKIRDLIRDLVGAGFVSRGGKGSHRNLKHSSGVKITISGKLGDDAKPYQERDVRKALKEAGDESK
jgi:predicted RNA binding protein YcfA (HicA-like mRNA interferase family)